VILFYVKEQGFNLLAGKSGKTSSSVSHNKKDAFTYNPDYVTISIACVTPKNPASIIKSSRKRSIPLQVSKSVENNHDSSSTSRTNSAQNPGDMQYIHPRKVRNPVKGKFSPCLLPGVKWSAGPPWVLRGLWEFCGFLRN